MDQLIQAGLAKTEREAKIKQNVGEIMQKVLLVKDVVSSAIGTMPQAPLAWTGVCFALQVSLLSIDVRKMILISKDLCKPYNPEQDKS